MTNLIDEKLFKRYNEVFRRICIYTRPAILTQTGYGNIRIRDLKFN